jgi:2'-5' RNA ligase
MIGRSACAHRVQGFGIRRSRRYDLPMPVPHASSRLFLAVWPDAAALERITGWRARQSWPAGVRLTPPEKLHATLHFIGEVPHAGVAPLAEALAAARFAPGQMLPGSAEIWAGGIAILHAEVDEPLLALHAQVAEVLRRQQLPLDARPWRPHITVARHAQGAQLLGLRPAPACAVAEFTLCESVGGRYDVLRRYPADQTTLRNRS